MAHAIPLTMPMHDPRAALQDRLRNAPAEHAEALLSAYEVLQGLHDAGFLDLARGALDSKDRVLEIAIDAAGSPESTRALRNLMLLSQMLGAIEPEVLKCFTQAAPQSLRMMVRQPEPPGLWSLIKDFLWNQDFRRGLSGINTMLSVFGSSLAKSDKSGETSR